MLGSTVTPYQDDRWCPVARDIGPRRVDDVREVNPGKVPRPLCLPILVWSAVKVGFNERLPKLSFHEGVCGDLAGIAAGVALPRAANGEFEDPLGERHRQGVGSGTCEVRVPIRFLLCLILGCNIWRVAHYDMVGTSTEQVTPGDESIDVFRPIEEFPSGGIEQAGIHHTRIPPVQQ